MRIQTCLVAFLLLTCWTNSLKSQQRLREREQEFMQSAPQLGDPLPDLTIYAADGRPFAMSKLRGHYTVLTFGCLTCPPSIWNISGLEAVHRDYSPKGVQFFFIYKALAHPELAGNYVQPFTLDERLTQARFANKQFGTQIPWIVDAMDNRLKHALGDRPNAQFLVDPDGKIVRKRAWANPDEVRKDLEDLVGPVEKITREDELQLKLTLPAVPTAPRDVVKRIPRPNLLPIVIEPQSDTATTTFYAKLRAEASAGLLSDGKGQLYLGFHLDPLHRAHWNNLNKPLAFAIESVDGVKIDPMSKSADAVDSPTDSDPREFLLTVDAWPAKQPLKLAVTYYACVDEKACYAIKQQYVLHRTRDFDGGGARSPGGGLWDSEDFARQLLRADADKDGKLSRSESVGIVLPHFEKLDKNHDGLLDYEELKTVGNWLNEHHVPGTPK